MVVAGFARTRGLQLLGPPLHPAASAQRCDIAVSLLESGAKLRIIYADGWSHRLAAKQAQQGPLKSAELFARRELVALLFAPRSTCTFGAARQRRRRGWRSKRRSTEG